MRACLCHPVFQSVSLSTCLSPLVSLTPISLSATVCRLFAVGCYCRSGYVEGSSDVKRRCLIGSVCQDLGVPDTDRYSGGRLSKAQHLSSGNQETFLLYCVLSCRMTIYVYLFMYIVLLIMFYNV